MANNHSNTPWQDGQWVPVPEGQAEIEPPMPLLDRQVIAAAAKSGDLEKALRIGLEHADASFDILHGAEVTSLETEAAFVRARAEVEDRGLTSTDRELAVQPHQIDAPFENGGIDGPGKPNTEIPPSKWLLRDQLTGVLSVAGIAGLAIASYYGIEASFKEAQLPIFEQNPHLAKMLAIMPAAAGYSVKLIGNTFTVPANRELYRKAIAVSGGIAFAAWIPIFSGLFEGISGVFDPFAAPKSHLGLAFNICHILSEVLIAAGLYGQLDAVLQKYSPSGKIDNPARPALERTRGEQVTGSEAWALRLARIEGRLKQLTAVHTKTRNIVEAAICERMNQTPPEGLL